MHWTVAGADAIIALRCKEASSQWEAICYHRHNQTGMPRGVTDFVGRASEVGFQARLVDSGRRRRRRPVLVVSGAPGVRKTSFAVHAAAALAETFPDRQLFLVLRCLDERPLEPTVILGRLINAVAPGQHDIPHDRGGARRAVSVAAAASPRDHRAGQRRRRGPGSDAAARRRSQPVAGNQPTPGSPDSIRRSGCPWCRCRRSMPWTCD